jgi:hypothetical protein
MPGAKRIAGQSRAAWAAFTVARQIFGGGDDGEHPPVCPNLSRARGLFCWPVAKSWE